MSNETEKPSKIEVLARQRVKDSMGALSYEDALVVATAQVDADEKAAAESSAADKKTKVSKAEKPEKA